MPAWRVLMLVSVCVLLCPHTSVRAQEAAADEATLTARYDAAVREAIAAQSSGDFEGAHALFEQAHALKPNARTLRGMGVASFQGRNFVRAIRELDAALVHPEKPLDAELRRAVDDLRTRAGAEVGIWMLRVEPSSALISIDQGAAQAHTEPLVLEPGSHQIAVAADGFVSQTLDITVKRGTREAMGVRLAPITAEQPEEVGAADQAAEPTKGAPIAQRAPSRRPHRLRMIGFYTALSLSGAAAITATTVFWAGKKRVDAIAKECRSLDADACSLEERSALEQDANLRRFQRTTNASWGVAGSALGIAIGLFGWDYFASGLRIDLRVSNTDVSVHGTF